MKRRFLAATAVALLLSGPAIAQTQNPAPSQDTTESARKGNVPQNPSLGGAGTPGAGTQNTRTQSADPEESRRTGTINQPSVPGTPGAGTQNTTVQGADPTEAARKGTINQPSGAGGTAVR
jgi:hypothetical protein